MDQQITLRNNGPANLILEPSQQITLSVVGIAGPTGMTGGVTGPTGVTGGRIIGYLAGWKVPPTAQALFQAGYTHVLVAFGVFSLATPGVIVPVFEHVTPDYIKTLHDVGIKVLLSIGGASSSAPNTTVDFRQVASKATSADIFIQTLIQSYYDLAAEYGFDGLDIDIEQGFNAPPNGTFANPKGDVEIVATILNRLKAQNPNILLTLAPQVANVAPSPAFDQTWGNYSSLIMQTYQALTWVGVQLYNTGGMYGIDQKLYAASRDNPDFSVAIATDLLENWPTTIGGRATGWQEYISYLRPDQVVLGYPSPNSKGQSDGAPYPTIAMVKRAVQCLRTGIKGDNSCNTYVPPRTYPGLGGVFNWEISYDQDNNFAFASGLKPCLRDGNCS